jgi:transposase
MISGFAVNQVYLATGFTDMRKSINGLSLLVSEQLVQDPFSGSVFVSVMASGCIIAVWIRANSSGQAGD